MRSSGVLPTPRQAVSVGKMKALDFLEGREQSLGSTDFRAKACESGDQLLLPGDRPLAFGNALLRPIERAP